MSQAQKEQREANPVAGWLAMWAGMFLVKDIMSLSGTCPVGET